MEISELAAHYEAIKSAVAADIENNHDFTVLADETRADDKTKVWKIAHLNEDREVTFSVWLNADSDMPLSFVCAIREMNGDLAPGKPYVMIDAPTPQLALTVARGYILGIADEQF